MGMGGNKNSNADGPIGFIDLPKTNDSMVSVDYRIVKILMGVLIGAWVKFMVIFLWAVIEYDMIEGNSLTWLVASFWILLIVQSLAVWYFAHYRGQQTYERTYLQQAAAHFKQSDSMIQLFRSATANDGSPATAQTEEVKETQQPSEKAQGGLDSLFN